MNDLLPMLPASGFLPITSVPLCPHCMAMKGISLTF